MIRLPHIFRSTINIKSSNPQIQGRQVAGWAAGRNPAFFFQKLEPQRQETFQGVDNVPWSETGRERDFLPSGGGPSCLQRMRGEVLLGPIGENCASLLGSVPMKKCLLLIQADLEQDPRSQEQPRRSKEAQT